MQKREFVHRLAFAGVPDSDNIRDELIRNPNSLAPRPDESSVIHQARVVAGYLHLLLFDLSDDDHVHPTEVVRLENALHEFYGKTLRNDRFSAIRQQTLRDWGAKIAALKELLPTG